MDKVDLRPMDPENMICIWLNSPNTPGLASLLLLLWQEDAEVVEGVTIQTEDWGMNWMKRSNEEILNGPFELRTWLCRCQMPS